MRIFTVVPKRTTVGGGGQGLGLDHGVETEDDTFSAAQTQPTGTETESLAVVITTSLDEGTETESLAMSDATGSAVYPQGTETETQGSLALVQTRDTGTESEADANVFQPLIPTGVETETQNSLALVQTRDSGTESEVQAFSAAQTRDSGTESGVFLSNASAALSQHTTTATAVTPNTPAWASPTNAQGAINGTEASHPGLSGVDTSGDATLRCAGLVVTATPSGFTRTSVGIRIVHRWDLTLTSPVAGVADVTHTIELRDSADVLIATLNTRSAAGGGGTQAALLTEDYDITSLVSDPQLAAGVKIDCHVVAAYTSAVNGNSSWNVDAVHLRASYTRSGIS